MLVETGGVLDAEFSNVFPKFLQTALGIALHEARTCLFRSSALTFSAPVLLPVLLFLRFVSTQSPLFLIFPPPLVPVLIIFPMFSSLCTSFHYLLPLESVWFPFTGPHVARALLVSPLLPKDPSSLTPACNRPLMRRKLQGASSLRLHYEPSRILFLACDENETRCAANRV
jgi:hypothetical protein